MSSGRRPATVSCERAGAEASRSSTDGGQGLIRTRSAEERNRAAAARREVRRAEAERHALSAELSAVQRELAVCRHEVADMAPTQAGGLLAVAMGVKTANGQIECIRRRHDKGHDKWPAHVSLLMHVPSLSAAAQTAVARAAKGQPPLLLRFTGVAAQPRAGRADGRTHVVLVLSQDSASRLADLQAAIMQATPIAAQSSGSGEGEAYRPHLTLGQAPTRADAVKLAQQLQSQLQTFLPLQETVHSFGLWHPATKAPSRIFPLADLQLEIEPEPEPEPEPDLQPQYSKQRWQGSSRATVVAVIGELRNNPRLLPFREQLGRLVTITFFDRHTGTMTRPLHRFVLDSNDPSYYETVRKAGDPIAASQHRFLQIHFNDKLVWDRGMPVKTITNSKGKVSYNVDSHNKQAKSIDRVLGSTGHSTMFDNLDSYIADLTPDENSWTNVEPVGHSEHTTQRFFVNIAMDALATQLSAVMHALIAHSSRYASVCMDARCLHVSLCLLDLTGREEQQQAQRILRSVMPMVSQLSPAGEMLIDVVGVAAFPQGRGVYAKPTAESAEWLDRVGAIIGDAMTAAGLRSRRHPPHISLAKVSPESRAAGVASIDEDAWVAFKDTIFGSVPVETVNLSASPRWMSKDATGFYHCLERLHLRDVPAAEAAVQLLVGHRADALPPLSDRGGATTLRIFDFDGTLFCSPEPNPDTWTSAALDMLRRSKKNGGLGWFETPLSLTPPAVMLNEAAGHFIEEVRAVAEESIADTSTDCYVLTGRTVDCKTAVSALLAAAGLNFEDVICKTAADKWKNNEYKKTWLAGLIKRHSPEYVEMWEDDPAIVLFLRSTFGEDRVRIHDVTSFVQYTKMHLTTETELELIGKLIRDAAKTAQGAVNVCPAVVYTAVVLDAESKLRCRSVCQQSTGGLAGWKLLCDHMTINLGCLDFILNPDVRVGDAVDLKCRKIGWSEHAAALHVDEATSANRIVTSGRAQTVQHVTLACAPDAQARDANRITQWTALGDIIQLRGHVREVRALVPSNCDTVSMQAMLQMMQNYGGEVSTRRCDVFTKLQSLCEQWWQGVYGSRGSMQLVSVGSFAVGADFAVDDIDVVVTAGCIAPGTETIQSLVNYLAVAGADAVRFVAAANGRRMLCLKLDDVDIDMLFSSLPLPPATELMIRSCDSERTVMALARADTFDIPELSSIRDTATIKLALASLPETVTQVLRFIKLWAKARCIYDNKLGYLGGSGWTVMVLHVALELGTAGCQTAPGLLRAVFARYATQASYPIGITLQTCGWTGAKVVTPSEQAMRDLRRTGLSVLTASPSRVDGTHDNIARNSTASTAARVWAELRRAHEYVSVATTDDESFYRKVGPTLLQPLSKEDIQGDFDAVLRISLHASVSLDTIALLNSRLVHLGLQLEGSGPVGSRCLVPLPARKLRAKPTLRLAVRLKDRVLDQADEFETSAHAWLETTLRGDMDEVDSVELVPLCPVTTNGA